MSNPEQVGGMPSTPEAKKSAEVIELPDVETLSVTAEGGPETYPATFKRLEEIAPLKGHRFYGVLDLAGNTYRACVQPKEEDDVGSWQEQGLEPFTIPGGVFAYKKITGEHDDLVQQVPGVFGELTTKYQADPTRPSIEFYKRFNEFRLYLPITELS